MGGADTSVRLRGGREGSLPGRRQGLLEGMRRIAFDPASGLTLGAAVTMNQVIALADVDQAYPLMAEVRSLRSILPAAQPGDHRRQSVQRLAGGRHDRRLLRPSGNAERPRTRRRAHDHAPGFLPGPRPDLAFSR